MSPDAPLVLLGSCFAENMAARMRRCLWNAANPLGTLYNPMSIDVALRAMLSDSGPHAFMKSLFPAGHKTCSWLFDSGISAVTADDCRKEFLRRSVEIHSLLRQAHALFVTFGTAWCYYLADDPGYVVANCHKQPSDIFVRRRLEVREIADRWIDTVRMLLKKYPHLQIVFTVSPVRHLKDGFEGNARSKATLILAVEEICRTESRCSYFPAYEIINDDLRDYRFYASDMVHPSEEAVEYLWEMWRATFVDVKGETVIREGEKLMKAWSHRLIPDATVEGKDEILENENRRREEIRLRHAAFRSMHPAVLPLS